MVLRLSKILFMTIILSSPKVNISALELSSIFYKEYIEWSPVEETRIEFFDDSFNYSYTHFEGKIEKKERSSFKFKIDNQGGISFILYGENYENKWLVLHDSAFILLYKDDGMPFFIGENQGGGEFSIVPEELVFGSAHYKVSSFLTEKVDNNEIQYPGENLESFELKKPRVEGVGGTGVGSTITISGVPESLFGPNYVLYVSNGYVSYSRPDLYKKNARVKKIKVTDKETGRSLVAEIKDSSDFTVINISDIYTVMGDIIVEILDVYPGTVFSDTCINIMRLYSVR
ncbi:MAG: hypothetical protein JW874_00290 [Spirochaetales bacterium]|nr:hypothetical protein [Spirochaetales bacterium]